MYLCDLATADYMTLVAPGCAECERRHNVTSVGINLETSPIYIYIYGVFYCDVKPAPMAFYIIVAK